MTEPKRYRISRNAPAPVLRSDYGLGKVPGVRNDFITTWCGEVTLDEYQTMFGSDANIVLDMVHATETREDGIAMTVSAHDVLAADSWNAMHHVIVNAFRVDQGEPELGDPEMEDRARGYHDISPDAVQFLMQMYDNADSAQQVDRLAELERARQAGLDLSDFLRW